jgi:hypothetical protein
MTPEQILQHASQGRIRRSRCPCVILKPGSVFVAGQKTDRDVRNRRSAVNPKTDMQRLLTFVFVALVSLAVASELHCLGASYNGLSLSTMCTDKYFIGLSPTTLKAPWGTSRTFTLVTPVGNGTCFPSGSSIVPPSIT